MTILRHPASTIAPLLTALLVAVPSAWAGEGSFSIQMFPFSVPVVGEDGLLHEAITAAVGSDVVVAVHVARGSRPAQAAVGENTLLGCRLGKSGEIGKDGEGGASGGKPVDDVFKKYR